jgi:hypothetical protein
MENVVSVWLTIAEVAKYRDASLPKQAKKHTTDPLRIYTGTISPINSNDLGLLNSASTNLPFHEAKPDSI